VPLAPSYDTVGWFARAPDLMVEVGKVLLDKARAPRRVKKLLIASDLFASVDQKVQDLLQPSVDRLVKLVGNSEQVDVAGGELAAWRNTFRVLQSEEAWAAQGDWIKATQPKFGPGVKERFAAAAVMDSAEIAAAKVMRKAIVERVLSLLTEDTVLVLPTAPGIAPLRNTPDAMLDVFRARAIELLCVSGHAGTPQVSLPVAKLDDCPIGLSIMGGRNCDEDVLQLAVELAR
jgi:amidase